MKLAYRLTMMFFSLAIILAIGVLSTGSLDFALSQFWFICGALLLILLSLVDQPNFSKDANVFINGATAWVSLFAVSRDQRSSLWWIFFTWAIYLVTSSFALMAIRSRELLLETKPVQLFSRINRAIGRPESIFSAFMLWGIFLQFAYPQDGATINSLLLFWAVFMILNVPSISQTVSSLFEKPESTTGPAGVVTGIQSPRIAHVRLSSDLPENLLGRPVTLQSESGSKLAQGTLFEDRIVRGLRQGQVGITSFGAKWNTASAGGKIELAFAEAADPKSCPVGAVAAGSSIGKLAFEVDPRQSLHEGEVVRVHTGAGESYYQIIGANIADKALAEGNVSQEVRVSAGQLGLWDVARATFNPIDWVPPAGELVVVSQGEGIAPDLPAGRCVVGRVPNSQFPVHVDISDSITHNTALVGVTGSGKSYLAFHLIESYLDAGIKVLILDLTRQHWQFLQHRAPTALRATNEVAAWLAGPSSLAIHQFANADAGFPHATADIVGQCFHWLQANTELRPGVDTPAKLCIVLEEAHSLIPEWNQVAQQSDTQQVNRTARVILQGRKFGLGSLLITQRTPNVTKTILNQCNTIFALRSFDQTGLDFLRNYMGEEYSQAISTLPLHTTILVGKASSSARPIILKIADFGARWNQNGQAAAPAAAPAPPPPPAAQ